MCVYFFSLFAAGLRCGMPLSAPSTRWWCFPCFAHEIDEQNVLGALVLIERGTMKTKCNQYNQRNKPSNHSSSTLLVMEKNAHVFPFIETKHPQLHPPPKAYSRWPLPTTCMPTPTLAGRPWGAYFVRTYHLHTFKKRL